MIYIDTQENLESICKILDKEKEISFDCEFIRESTFVPVLCLVQISTRDKIYIIDPIELNLEPLLALLKNNSILKIMHSCTQDIDVFYKNFSFIPKPIFDTQMAAGFLGYGDSISYAKLVKKITKVALSKDSKLTNWLLRPLNKAQLNYAQLDVKYLFDLYDHLLSKLQFKNREEWFVVETNNLYDVSRYYVDPNDAWKRVNSSGNKPFFLNYLQAYARFREGLAVSNNRPRRFMIKDEILIQLANLQPKTKEDISNDRILRKLLSDNLIEELVEVSMAVDKSQELTVSKHKKLLGNKELICDLLKMFLKYTANKYDVATKYIARTEEIEHFVQQRNMNNIRFLSGWRNDIYGQQAQKILDGKIIPRISDKKLIFVEE